MVKGKLSKELKKSLRVAIIEFSLILDYFLMKIYWKRLKNFKEKVNLLQKIGILGGVAGHLDGGSIVS